jgi:peptidoglycan/xylan/chitin deacetylase (PgdA/CDA1 family)
VEKIRWFRPPGGDCSAQTLRVVDALGYTTVMWTTNTGDWHLTRPESIAQNALRGLGPGGIILMHQDGLQSVQALGDIIRGVRKAGLTLEPAGEMVDDKAIVKVSPGYLLPLMHRAQIDL